MPSLLVVHYETSTGAYITKKVGSSQIEDLAVTSAKLATAIINLLGTVADGAITSAKIASGIVGSVHLADQAVTSSDIAINTIGNIHILNQGILSSAFGTNIIATPHILNQGILSASIGAGVIGHALVTDYGIVSGKIASGAVTENQLVSGISIDLAEMAVEPTYRAQVPISGLLAIQFSVSGYFSFARAGDISSMPAIGIVNNFILSGQIGTFLYGGRMTNAGWNFSGYIGRLLYTGTSSEVTIMVSGLMVSGQCVQRLAKVAGPNTIFVKPDPIFVQIAE